MFSNSAFQAILPFQRLFPKLLSHHKRFSAHFDVLQSIGFIAALSNGKLSLDVAFCKGEIAYNR